MPTVTGIRCRTRLAHRLGAPRNAIAALAAFAAFWPNALATSTLVEAKTPGKTYCFYKVCHRVMTLEETRRAVGKRMVVHASHYDDPRRDRFNPSNLTSSGEFFRAGVPDNAASPKLPNGTVILAWNPATRQSAVLRINNAGPYWRNRTLDVSRAAADRLGFGRTGVAIIHIQVLRAATPEDVRYRKGRRYAAVPGPIGTHGSLELAALEAHRRMGLRIDPPATTIQVAAAAQTAPGSEILSTDVDAATAQAHLPTELPAAVPVMVVAEAASPPSIQQPVLARVSLVSANDNEEAAPGVVALASAASPSAGRVAAPKRSTEEAAKTRRPPRQARQQQLASLNLAPAVTAAPPRRVKANAAAKRKQVAAFDRRRDRRDTPRAASRPPQAEQQRLADLDDFDDEDVRPARSGRKFASTRPRYFED